MEGLASACYVFGNDKAKACVDSGAYQKYLGDKMSASSKLIDDSSYPENKSDKREERRKKAAGGKAGGGAQGRETKTKSVKKHQRSKQNTADSDSDDENTYSKSASSRSLELVTLKDIKKCLLPLLKEDEIEYLLDDLAEYLLP